MKGMDRLLGLQDIDLEINRLEARRLELERGDAVEAGRAAVRAEETRVGDLRTELDTVKREEARLEGDVTSLDLRIRQEQGRLFDGSVANPKELQSIQAEVNNLRARKARLEDEELEQMAKREELETRLPPMEQELGSARESLSSVEEGAERELEEVASAIEKRRAEREAASTEIDEELLELYEDLRAQKRGVGAAALVDGVCQGCHQKLSALELDRIKRSEGIRRCDYCRRILIPS